MLHEPEKSDMPIKKIWSMEFETSNWDLKFFEALQ